MSAPVANQADSSELSTLKRSYLALKSSVRQLAVDKTNAQQQVKQHQAALQSMVSAMSDLKNQNGDLKVEQAKAAKTLATVRANAAKTRENAAKVQAWNKTLKDEIQKLRTQAAVRTSSNSKQDEVLLQKMTTEKTHLQDLCQHFEDDLQQAVKREQTANKNAERLQMQVQQLRVLLKGQQQKVKAVEAKLFATTTTTATATAAVDVAIADQNGGGLSSSSPVKGKSPSRRGRGFSSAQREEVQTLQDELEHSKASLLKTKQESKQKLTELSASYERMRVKYIDLSKEHQILKKQQQNTTSFSSSAAAPTRQNRSYTSHHNSSNHRATRSNRGMSTDYRDSEQGLQAYIEVLTLAKDKAIDEVTQTKTEFKLALKREKELARYNALLEIRENSSVESKQLQTLANRLLESITEKDEVIAMLRTNVKIIGMQLKETEDRMKSRTLTAASSSS